jgi:transcriptional regulator with XRE-family HTH domain
MGDLSAAMADKALRPKWNGAALKRHREARGWKVEDLAEALGASPGLVYKWEAGDSMPKADWLAAIVLVLNQPAIRFFTGLDEYQARMKGGALVSRRELPVDVEGQETEASYFTAGSGAAAALPDESREPERRSPPTSAKHVSEPKHGRRSPKRRA